MWRHLVWGLVVASALCGSDSFARLRKLPSLGSRFNDPTVPDSIGVCMVSPGQMDKCARVEVAGVQYTVAYRKKAKFGKPVVTYIHTSDPKFIAPSGKRVGDLLEIDYVQVVRSPGFEIYAIAPQGGWTAVIGFNGKATTGSGEDEPLDFDTLANRNGPLRLRITGFTAR